MTAEPRGTYTVGGAPLIASAPPACPSRSRTVIVMLSADGMLYTCDLATAARLRDDSVAPRRRRRPWLRNDPLTLRCLGTPDGRQFAIMGGPGIRTSIWNLSTRDLSTGRPVATLPARATPAAIEFTALSDGRMVIVASIGGAEWRLCDLQTGQELPYERRRIRSTRLRSLYDRFIRGSRLTYYEFRGGPPRVAVRFFRKTAIVWDLTASLPAR